MKKKFGLIFFVAPILIIAFQNCAPFQPMPGALKGDIDSTGGVTPDPEAQPESGEEFSTDRKLFFGESRCATADFIICEDFESGAWAPEWKPVLRNVATLAVDEIQSARGKKALHIQQTANGGAYLSRTQGLPLPENVMFGRLFMYIASGPYGLKHQHWSIVKANDDISVGGEIWDGINNFGMGSDFGITGDWLRLDRDPYPGAPPKKGRIVPLHEWMCVEWMFDGKNHEARFWWDGVEHTSMRSTKMNHGGNAGDWIIPSMKSLWVGWREYQVTTQFYDLWIDEIAIDDKRIGCIR